MRLNQILEINCRNDRYPMNNAKMVVKRTSRVRLAVHTVSLYAEGVTEMLEPQRNRFKTDMVRGNLEINRGVIGAFFSTMRPSSIVYPLDADGRRVRLK